MHLCFGKKRNRYNTVSETLQKKNSEHCMFIVYLILSPHDLSHWSATVMTPPQKYCNLDVIKRLINQSRLVKTGWNWSKLVKTGWNWLKLVQTGQNYQNWLKLVMAFLVQRPTGPLSEPNFSSIWYFESWMTFHVLWNFDNSEYFHS